MKLKEEQKERLRTLTVEFLLDMHRQALQNGWNPLDLWDQVTNRMRAAARTSAGPDEWTSAMMLSLKITSPSKDSSTSLLDLSACVRELDCARAWLDLIDREFGLLTAMARKVNEERRAARLAAQDPSHAAATTTAEPTTENAHV